MALLVLRALRLMFNLEGGGGGGVEGGRDGGSVECAETPLFCIKGFGFPLLFSYSPTVIKETTSWNTADEKKGSGTVNKERKDEEGMGHGERAGGSEKCEKQSIKEFQVVGRAKSGSTISSLYYADYAGA